MKAICKECDFSIESISIPIILYQALKHNHTDVEIDGIPFINIARVGMSVILNKNRILDSIEDIEDSVNELRSWIANERDYSWMTPIKDNTI